MYAKDVRVAKDATVEDAWPGRIQSRKNIYIILLIIDTTVHLNINYNSWYIQQVQTLTVSLWTPLNSIGED